MKMIVTAALACILTLPQSASAQDWPVRPVTMVVPYVAGGPQDVLGRLIAQGLAETLGRSFIIDNAGGAGGMTGALRVAKAPPDGYQMLLGGIGLAYSQTYFKKPPYDAVADFVPVGMTVESPRILIARKSLSANTLAEFVAYARANQGRMQFGSSGTGTPMQPDRAVRKRHCSEISGFSQQYISGLEQGRRNPAVITIYELPLALGVNHLDLLRLPKAKRR